MGPDPRSREQNQLPGEGGVDIRLAGGWIEVASNVHPPGEVVVSMRPVSVFAKAPGSEIEQLRGDLQGRWRQAGRAVMVLLSLHGLPPAQIAELLDCHPATVRRWISRFNREGLAGLADRPRSGRPALGGRRLTSRIAALLGRPGPWTLPRIRRCLGWPQVSPRTLYRRIRLVAIWQPVESSGAGLRGPPLPEQQGLSSSVCMHVLNKTLFDLDLEMRRENNPRH